MVVFFCLRKNLCVLIFVFIFTPSQSLYSQKIIPAGPISGVWSKTVGPYKIQGDVTIPKDSTLIIEPGTVIEFQDKFAIKVDGILKAEGKLGDSIVFKGATSKVWAGIHFIDNWQSDTIRFNYCKFINIGSGTKYKLNIFALRFTRGGPVKITNCTFQHDLSNVVQGGYIAIRRNVGIIENISIIGNAKTRDAIGGINIDSSLYFSLKKIEFSLPLVMSKLGGDEIVITDFNATYGHLKSISNASNTSMNMTLIDANKVLVEDVLFIDNTRIIISNSKNCKFSNCKFINSYNTAIKSSNNCTGTIFENCEIRNCGSNTPDSQWNMIYRSMFLESSGPLFKNCKFIDNQNGIGVGQQNGSGTPIFLNCEFTGSKYYTLVVEGFPVFVNCNFTNNRNFYRYPGDTAKLPPYTGCITISSEFYNSRPYFYNCLFWGNRDSLGNPASLAFLSNNSKVRADLYNCILQGDSATGVGGYDDNTFKKFKVNPAYFTYVKSSGHPPGFKDSASGNYSLKNTCDTIAYAINRGMTGNLLTQYPYSMLSSQYGIDIYNSEDLAGNPRVMDDTIDIGCYESSGTKHALDLLSTYRDSIICYGGSNSYKVKTYGTVQNYNWQLKNGNSIQTISSSNTLVLNNQRTNGLKYRIMVSNSECEDLSDSSVWFTLYVNGPIKKGITRNPNKDTIELKETMTLSTTATGYNQIKWSNGQTGPSISFKGSDLGNTGTYRFELEARKNDGCIETDTAFVVVKENTSLESLLIKGWKVYPNPTNGIIYLDSPNGDFYSVELTDWMGNSILIKNNLSDQSTINIAELPSGVYHVKLITIDFIEVIKVLKL